MRYCVYLHPYLYLYYICVSIFIPILISIPRNFLFTPPFIIIILFPYLPFSNVSYIFVVLCSFSCSSVFFPLFPLLTNNFRSFLYFVMLAILFLRLVYDYSPEKYMALIQFSSQDVRTCWRGLVSTHFYYYYAFFIRVSTEHDFETHLSQLPDPSDLYLVSKASDFHFILSQAADMFYTERNMKPFNSMEPELVQLLFVRSVDVTTGGDIWSWEGALNSSYNNSSKSSSVGGIQHSSGDGENGESAPSTVELPTCPVCLGIGLT